jgi:hypothetical protein
MSLASAARSAASWTSAIVADGRPYCKLYASVSLNSTVSCGTTPMAARSDSMDTVPGSAGGAQQTLVSGRRCTCARAAV